MRRENANPEWTKRVLPQPQETEKGHRFPLFDSNHATNECVIGLGEERDPSSLLLSLARLVTR